MSTPNRPALPVRSTADLLAVLPYLIGYTPTDSLVCLALAGVKVLFVARIDLPETTAGPVDTTSEDPASDGAATSVPGRPGPDQPDAYETVASLAALVAARNPTGVVLVGYGTHDRATPVLDLATRIFTAAGLEVMDALRVHDARYFRNNGTGGCPAEGTPFDPSSSPAAAHAVLAGAVAFPDRAASAARLAPVEGPERDAMAAATVRAVQRVARLVNDPRSRWQTLSETGRAALTEALDRYRGGRRLDDDEAAFLTVLLVHPPTRDQALSLTDTSDHHTQLWADLTRRAHPDLVAPPASLLAYAAWRSGDGVLANHALERALHADPDDELAQALGQLVGSGLPPSDLDAIAD